MLQRLSITLSERKAGNIWKLTKWNLANIFFISSKRNYWKIILQYNEFSKGIIPNGCYIFVNSENKKSSDSHTLLLNLSDQINFKKSNKYIATSNLIIYYRWKNMKQSYKNDKYEISPQTWNDKFALTDGSCSVSKTLDHQKNKKSRDWYTSNNNTCK